MGKNMVKNIAETAIMAGTLLFTFGTANTPISINYHNNQNYSFMQKASTTNESELLSLFDFPKDKFKVEDIAEDIFGKMRSATKEEQKAINNYLDGISTPIGVNFWDLC